MATHDYNIANQGFPAFRSDLNNSLSAIVSNNSNATEPSTTYAYQWWYDTSTDTLKFRNADNDAWVSFATFDMANDTVNLVDSAIDVVTDTTPQLGGMLDVNGNAIGNGTEELIKFSETASAVNEVTVTNSATGNAPEISATGDDTNIDLKLTPKGSGNLNLDGLIFPNADGTTGQFLKTDGSGNLSFDDASGGSNTPAFFAYLSSDQNISNNTLTKIQYNTEDFDTNSMYDNSSNYRFTPTIAGKYFVYACATISATAYVAYATQLNLRKNGGDYIVNRATTANDALLELTVHCSGVIDFNGSTDYVEVYGLSERHTGSAQQKFVAANRRSHFGAYRIIE